VGQVRSGTIRAGLSRLGALVEPGGPAEEGGIRTGDLVVSFAGRPVRGIDDLQRRLGEEAIGREVPVTVLRLGRLLDLTAVPREARAVAAG